jgi:hypothetical protein
MSKDGRLTTAKKFGFEVLITTGLLDNECFIAWLGSASLAGGVV